jgi:hypothetical protein
MDRFPSNPSPIEWEQRFATQLTHFLGDTFTQIGQASLMFNKIITNKIDFVKVVCLPHPYQSHSSHTHHPHIKRLDSDLKTEPITLRSGNAQSSPIPPSLMHIPPKKESYPPIVLDHSNQSKACRTFTARPFRLPHAFSHLATILETDRGTTPERSLLRCSCIRALGCVGRS